MKRFSNLRHLYNEQFSGPAGSVFRGMSTLALGTGTARLLGVVSIPLLTRIYSPEDYGVLAVFTSLVALLVPFLTLRYVTALPLPRTNAMAMNLMALSALLLLGLTATITAVLAVFGSKILGLVSMQILAPWWGLIALGVLGAGIYEMLSMWATRRRAYKIIAKTQVTQAFTGQAIKIGLGLLSIKPLGLLIGQIAAQSGGIGSFVKRFHLDFQQERRKITWQRMKFIACYYRSFPIYRLPSQVLLVFSAQAPLLFCAALYDGKTTGQLGLAMMSLTMPITLIGNSMAKAYYAEMTIIKNVPGKVRSVTMEVQKKLFIIGTPLALVIAFFGQDLFSLVFGEKWSLAGKFSSLLSFFTLLQLTSSPLMQVLNFSRSQLSFLVLNAIRTLGLFAIFLSAKICGLDSYSFVASLGIFLFVFYGGVSIWVFKIISGEARSVSGIRSGRQGEK